MAPTASRGVAAGTMVSASKRAASTGASLQPSNSRMPGGSGIPAVSQLIGEYDSLDRPGSGGSGRRPGSGDSVRAAGRMLAQCAAPAQTSTSKERVRRSASLQTVPGTRHTASRRSAGAGNACQNEPCMHSVADQQLSIDHAAERGNRAALVEAMQKMPNFNPGNDVRAFHGRAFCIGKDVSTLSPPATVWRSDQKPRNNSPDWLTATEYKDTPAVFREKVQFLARLLRCSSRSMAYTGAGLSVAAGIGMAAVGSQGGSQNGGGMGVGTAGEPTLSHCVMAELNRQNLLQGWVQQNHDGLPQKAGYKQEDINEVHGSWFDPSNPVVKYSGSLRHDFFENMEEQADTSDLVLVLGTSLTGLNADQCVTKTAERSMTGCSLGSVIISPQRTSQDGKAALRIFAKSDDVMAALSKEFGFGPRALGKARGIRCSADLFTKEDRVEVPYDEAGVRSETVRTYLDLSRGQKVRLGSHHNVQGAKQPQDKNITEQTIGTVLGRDAKTCSIAINFDGVTKRLGLWWLETAQRGGVERLPIVSVSEDSRRAALPCR